MRNPPILIALILAGCASNTAIRAPIPLNTLDPLRDHFNSQRDRPRIIGLFSPT